MYEGDAARRDARKTAVTRVAGDASANPPTPIFDRPFGAAVGVSIAPARAG
jgi:hypothetical protein